MYHGELATLDLLGREMPIWPQIPRAGGRYVKDGVIFEASPEEQAFQRWSEGRFDDLERLNATAWRKGLEELDLAAVAKEVRELGFNPQRTKTLADVKKAAVELANGTANPYARLALIAQFLRLPPALYAQTVRRWNRSSVNTLPEFAPYAAHVLSVEMFFQIALGAGLIGSERPSNRTDIAYLFYLPLCMAFVSSDKLHRNTAPLFMGPNQEFIWGADLKAALKTINAHFLQLPEEVREQGISSFAGRPPPDNLVADLWDRHLRSGYRDEKPAAMTPEQSAALVARLKEFTKRQTAPDQQPLRHEDVQMMALQRMVKRKRGSWWQVPKGLKGESEDDSDTPSAPK